MNYGKERLLPSIPDLRTGRVEDAVQAMKEWIEVRQGALGDGLDRAVTMRDLLNSGLASGQQIASIVPGPAPIPIIPPIESPDIPPTPTDLSATGTLKHIFLTWEFARGYSRLAHFEVWRSETNSLGSAILLAQPYATTYADAVAPESTYYYWVRAVSDAGVSPFNSVAGVQGETPFFLQENDTVVNGEPVVPRMYIKAGYIMNGIITNAKIGDLAVDNAKIVDMSVAKLTAGKLGVSEYIESTNYLSGSAGWRINGNGNAEFSNVTVRGTVLASAGSIGGTKIDATGLQSANYDGAAGWRISADGSALFGSNVTFKGQLSGATGTFSGSLSGATGTFSGSLNAASGTFYGDGTFSGDLAAAGGTFSGTLTASAINAVKTINVAGNAITGLAAATGGAATVPAGGETALCAASLNMPSGSAGLLVNVNVALNSASNSSQHLRIYKDGYMVAAAGVSLLGGFATTAVFTWMDSDPDVGSTTYSFHVANPTVGPGSNVSATVSSSAIVLSGAKR